MTGQDDRPAHGRLRTLGEFAAIIGALLAYGVVMALFIALVPKDISLAVLAVLIVIAVVGRLGRLRI